MARSARHSSSKPVLTETALHMQVARYLRLALPSELVFFHVPNGELRDARTAGKLKAMGVLAGVPDFTILLPQGRAGFIELKTARGALSDAQIDLRAKLVALNCGYQTCRSVDEVAETITRWLAAYGLEPRATLQGRAA